MLENQIGLITKALESCFDRVLDLFDGINMSEHKNELLCFAGIDSYKLSEAFASGSSSKRTAEVKYLIRALSRKNMTADELCELFDDKVIPAVEGCGANVSEMKRNPCVYSKEQGCYVVSAELLLTAEEPSDSEPEHVSFGIGGTLFTCMRSFEISRVVKTAETPIIGNVIKSRIVGMRPMRITVNGEAAKDSAALIYSSLSLYLGAALAPVSVGGMTFSNMAMIGLDLDASAGSASKIRVEFTEVNDT